ncbi:TraR/DksA family transcriptional regulator [Virgibacillus halophilus]|uniref:DksA C4-type domain-containing protein n=1 Tax=Tigheibacillus halophilus TaxID=361280 RepID=A0ABU5C1H3_9BACI|nr:hypothetical protein [Virgibacillus halophilus]
MPKDAHLNEQQLNKFKQRLLNMKTSLKKELGQNKESPNDAVQEPADYSNHPADIATEQFEQERAAGFDMIKRDQLQAVNDSLDRIEDGTYGYSIISGKPIPIERLEAEPTAKTLVDEKG